MIARANDSEFGLGGSVWSNDLAKANRMAERILSGTGETWHSFALDATAGCQPAPTPPREAWTHKEACLASLAFPPPSPSSLPSLSPKNPFTATHVCIPHIPWPPHPTPDGAVWVNEHTPVTWGPFGGFRQSGIGRELGSADVSAFTEMQTLSLAK